MWRNFETCRDVGVGAGATFSGALSAASDKFAVNADGYVKGVTGTIDTAATNQYFVTGATVKTALDGLTTYEAGNGITFTATTGAPTTIRVM